ncbi:MAG: CDP-diacylglycerol--serine O-phosphatidyltransferase, partial [Opitutae bacterium]|nr:CDP-diacylglycerol--serine O-phosphatidyltransferase [Opitutae bacterium]
SPQQLYTEAVWLILAAILFDILDGRLARLGGRESLFGKEFDSLADVVSFGMAPSLMVFFLILSPTQGYPFFRDIGWIIGFIYLLCVAVRLSRFNVVTHPLISESELPASKHFIGLPAPAAAGMISSLVLLLNKFDLKGYSIALPILMLMIAFLMISPIHYPSFKYIGWTTRLNFRFFILIIVIVSILAIVREIGIVLIFLGYLFYGLFLHLRRRRYRPNGETPDQ